MWPFRRKKTKKYRPEDMDMLVKTVRTHIGAQAGMLSTLTTLIQGIDQRDRDQLHDTADHRERVERSLSGLHEVLRDQAAEQSRCRPLRVRPDQKIPGIEDAA